MTGLRQHDLKRVTRTADSGAGDGLGGPAGLRDRCLARAIDFGMLFVVSYVAVTLVVVGQFMDAEAGLLGIGQDGSYAAVVTPILVATHGGGAVRSRPGGGRHAHGRGVPCLRGRHRGHHRQVRDPARMARRRGRRHQGRQGPDALAAARVPLDGLP